MLRLTILACLTAAGIGASHVASAACTDPNTCFGTGALQNNVDGQDNSAFGFQALASDVHGWQNTAVGTRALFKNQGQGGGCEFQFCVPGAANTAIGADALKENLTGQANTATGFWALLVNSTGKFNVANGNSALERNTIGQENTAIGSWALKENRDGSGNTAVGTEALLASIEQSGNTAVGIRALRGFNWDGADRYRLLGSSNSAFGASALSSNDSGEFNTAVGSSALSGHAEFGISGSFNTASGSNSLRANTSGSGNTASGFDSLHSNSSGFRNTASGVNALGAVTTGVRNTAMGAAAGKNVTTGSDNIVIGAEVSGAAAQNGEIRIGSSARQKKTYIAGIRGVKTGLAAATAVFIDANGQLGTIKSSREAKENIQSMGSVSERLSALRPVTFRYKETDDDGGKPVQFGLIAEEVAETFPELVVYDENGKPETVSYHLLSTLLLNEFQEERRITQAQALHIEQQSAELAQLKQQFAEMAVAIEKLDQARLVAATE